jgi:Ca2+-transporting ATPase
MTSAGPPMPLSVQGAGDDPQRPPVADAQGGLTAVEAAARLRRDGPNVLPEPERRHPLAIVGNVLREPMLLLLLAATSVYMLLGDPGEAALLGASVFIVIGLTVYQERKSERALQALRELGTPRARVLRDGRPSTVPSPEVVVDDVLLVAEGDRIAADARVVEETDLHADESLLTGESVPVRRSVTAPDAGGDALLHASTLVVRGHGRAVVVATGARTAVGRIGVALRSIHTEPTRMQAEIRRMVLVFSGLALASCVLVAGLYLATRGGWLPALLAGLTLAMSVIPEEFPVVLAVFLALGAWRMAQQHALVRRTVAIEALGATTVLCTDKTGTLTLNRMAVAELHSDGAHGTPAAAADPRLQALLETAALASRLHSHDPMDIALHDAFEAAGGTTAHRRHLREYPLSPECPAVAHAWLDPDGRRIAACKGAPEAVARLCGLTDAQSAHALEEVAALARRGLRVLAAAQADAEVLPATLQAFAFQWRGLVGFADPLRPGVADAVAEARAAGVRVIMLTGDHVETAREIARQAGIASDGDVLSGRDIDAMDDTTLARQVASAHVFARVRPEHKLRLVGALKRNGDVVAMTGDGVNDAPALMAAHVGVAMGGRGTDVAREAASIVLLDDNFVTVVAAIRQGRTIYGNIRRAVHYILAVHVPIAGLAVLPLLAGGPLVLLPLHVVFLELIIDPACTIVFERETPTDDIMRRPPRPPSERLLRMASLLASLGHGAAMLLVLVALYAAAQAQSLAAAQVGGLAFTALVAGNLGLITLYRAGGSLSATLRQRNDAFWIVSVLAWLLLALVTRLPAAARWFGFAPAPLPWWLLAVVLPLLVAAGLKRLAHLRRESAAPGSRAPASG